jgi:hypothetical protein
MLTNTCEGRSMSEQPTLFDATPEPFDQPDTPSAEDRPEANAGKRSIRYMAQMALEYGKIGSLADLLDRVACFPVYKPYNALLVLLQRPAATIVLPAHEWGEKYGRVIRPNEQPLVMLQPGGPVMFLFDVSQTEDGPGARALPLALASPYQMRDTPNADVSLRWVINNAKFDGVRVLNAALGLPFAGCARRTQASLSQSVRPKRTADPIDVPVRFDVLLNRSYSPTEQLATLAHELGHLYCGHLGPDDNPWLLDEEFWRDRSRLDHDRRELEAESVARVVFKRLDPGNPLPEHLSQYFTIEPDLNDLDLEPILTAAGRVLEMAAGHAPRKPKQGRRARTGSSEKARKSD